MKAQGFGVFCLVSFLSSGVLADTTTVTVHAVAEDGQQTIAGQVTFADSEHGLLVRPDLKGLTPGPAGAHIHEHPSCDPMEMDGRHTPAGAAGGHFDPHGTGTHAGPYGDGHLGDLPNLFVEADGTARIPVLAPRLRVSDIANRALIIHGGADRYADHGAHHHGKGGGRMYCGVFD